MNRFMLMLSSFTPFIRKYLKLDREEAELRPKVKAGIEKVMANGDSVRKKAVTDHLKEKMTECGL